MTVQLPLGEQIPIDRDSLVQAWHERAAELQHQAGLSKGRAELRAFYELGDRVRAQTTPHGAGARRCAWCGERCLKPMAVRPGLAGVVVCSPAHYSEFWIDRRTRIDARLYQIGCRPEPTKEDIAAIDQAIEELEPPRV
jgi:hypothetical protein